MLKNASGDAGESTVPFTVFRDFYTTDLLRKRQTTAFEFFVTIPIQGDKRDASFTGIPECAFQFAEFYCCYCAKHTILHQKGAFFFMRAISLKPHLSMEANRLIRCSPEDFSQCLRLRI